MESVALGSWEVEENIIILKGYCYCDIIYCTATVNSRVFSVLSVTVFRSGLLGSLANRGTVLN